MQQPEWPKIAVLGAGAVGCFYGALLARAGAPVTLIGRPGHVDAIRRDGLVIDSVDFPELKKVTVEASTDVAAARGAGIVLLSVKTLATESAARELAPLISPETFLVSLQNGVDNIERIRRATGIEAVAAAVYVAAEMIGPGRLRHNGRSELVIGNLAGQTRSRSELERLSAVCERGGIGCPITDNLDGELWMKLILNCAYNGISGLGRSNYARMTSNPYVRETMQEVAREIMAVAAAAGIRLPADPVEKTIRLADSMPMQVSSTAHDMERGRATEIDSLNGYVVRRGRELGIPTPVNQAIYGLVKLVEEGAATR